ncbi:DUF3102 domain-containing protein [Candidatus Solirubrobacter pratensis]|uniref:DUF3102 domain-containing protein n=1 Tax=Candidatus Solirubrobacter pratensis TaxID=1298857 RepID=UPI0004848157|nr:DUF3102 domain-containing protein [Candidatus Solirubrobacter pratensis]
MTTLEAVPSSAVIGSWSDRKLDNSIRKGHAAAGSHKAAYEQHATVTGILLIERKRRLKHGAWLPWLAENFEGSTVVAQRYMRQADEWLANTSSATRFDPPAEHPTPPVEDTTETCLRPREETGVPVATPGAPEHEPVIATHRPGPEESKRTRRPLTEEEIDEIVQAEEEKIAQMRRGAAFEAHRTRALASLASGDDAYTAVVAAIDAIARARGKVDARLAGELGEAHKIVRRVLMSLHEAGESHV